MIDPQAFVQERGSGEKRKTFVPVQYLRAAAALDGRRHPFPALSSVLGLG